MAGWSCPDNETNIWDGTLAAKRLKYKGQDTDARYITGHNQTQPGNSLNTIYDNLDDDSGSPSRPIIVYGTVSIIYDDAGDYGYIECKTGATSPPTTVRQRVGPTLTGNVVTPNSFFTVSFPFSFVVPNQNYYTITSTVVGSGTVTLIQWNEVRL